MRKNYYVVRGGRNIGLFTDYNQAVIVSLGKTDRIKEFSNYHIALHFLNKITQDAIKYSQKPNGDFIHSDVSVNNVTGFAEFRVMRAGKILVQSKSIEFCTSHIAEFLALVEAYKYAKHYKIEDNIYCDNFTAIRWFKKEIPLIVPPSLNAANPKLKKNIDSSLEYVNTLQEGYSEKVIFWDASMWGDIPSDYGRKKNLR